jgi:hypothetical protein
LLLLCTLLYLLHIYCDVLTPLSWPLRQPAETSIEE